MILSLVPYFLFLKVFVFLDSFYPANSVADVQYVGSKRCAACHGEIYDSYMKSEMGRSMSAMNADNLIERFPQQDAVYDSASNYYYEMVQREGGFYQREFRKNSAGTTIHERLMQADYVIGSGNNLRMYFRNENGMLYELPLTWYVHRKRWELSPGYREFGNRRFSRYAGEKCISCHNSYLERYPGANDRYKEPFPLGVGCERCHGPGELHVKQKMGEHVTLPAGAHTIVNPRKLPPREQLSVCQQCHLQGKAAALNGTRSWFDFRPGANLETNRSVYFPAFTQKEVFEVADSPHRLSLSRCFKESGGGMTCISCHDPHRSIRSFTKDHYNQKCLGCHNAESLSAREGVHIHSASQNCISCHMNATGSDNTLHGVSNTDHWIRVDASKTVIDWTPLRTSPERRSPIALVPDVDANDGGQFVRKGIAYLDYYKEHDSRRLYLDSALFYLTFGHGAGKRSSAWFSLGEVFDELGRPDEAIRSYERAVALQPSNAQGFFKLGRAYAAKKTPELAVRAMRKAVQLKPQEPSYLEGLGSVLAAQGRLDEAVAMLKKSTAIDNVNPSAHYSLGVLLAIDLKQPKLALTHFKQLVVLDPDFPNGFLNLGNTFFVLNRLSDALDAYHTELANNPRSVLAWVNVGRILMLRGKNSEARRAFERALAIDPSMTVARDYLQQLR